MSLRCRILIGATTKELLDGSFVTREIGLLEVRGKINRLPVFQVLDELAYWFFTREPVAGGIGDR